MMRFNKVRLVGDEAGVSGPIQFSEFGPLVFAHRIEFAVAQADVMIRGEDAHPGGDQWGVRVPAGGLRPGPAFAFAVAMLTTENQPGLQTFTWFEQVEVVTPPA
jgi:hypothetical protein